MEIIDSHMHLPYSVKGMENKKVQLLEQMRNNGISYGIVISDSSIKSEIGTLIQCVELFENEPNIFIVGGISPLIAYENQLKILEKYLITHRIIGIKLYCGHEAFYLNDMRLDSLYKLAGRFNVPVLFHSGWDNNKFSAPEVVLDIVEKYLNIKFVCCHLYYPEVIKCLEVLKDCDNVYFDLSSLADNILVTKTFDRDLTAWIQKMPERFLFGSDYEGCNPMEHIQFIKNLKISDMEMEKVFYLNSKKIYKLAI